MVQKYVFGTCIETGAVVIPVEEGTGAVPYLNMESDHRYFYEMGEKDAVYGLGEAIRGINKRGWEYEAFCNDDPNHVENIRSLYGAHNFFIVDGKETFGIFVDAPQRIRFDIGYTKRERLEIEIGEGGYVLYVIEGQNPMAIIKEFRHMIGRSYIPPKWAFGYGQSRWGYKTEADIRRVAEEHIAGNIPLDSIYLDIDYMERYKDFTVDTERFPNLKRLAEEYREQGIHLVPIIDAGVKVEDGYSVYEEGVENGYFCIKKDGSLFAAGVWPGKVHFPDFFNPKAREWFGKKYQILLAQGIEGFWNDMNEPAIFYSEDHMQEVFEGLETYRNKNLDVDTFFGMKDLVTQTSNRMEDYKSFYHQVNGEKIRHDQVHNLYGYNMTRAAGEAFEQLEPDKRILMFSRASYIGMHRYGGVWMGDNQSWWSHILLNLKMLPSLNMCGFLYTGADLGGFGSDTTEDLMLRWLELGIFTPLMRNHSAMGTREQEFYRFGHTEDFRNIIRLRYGLLPYLYSEFMKAVLNEDMMFTPLAFAYESDVHGKEVEDQMMIGKEVMIAPVYTQNATGRYVYLPEEMKLYRFRSVEDMDTEILSAGHHYVKAELNEVLVFLRPDSLVPLANPGRCVEQTDCRKLTLLHFIKDGAEYELYDDDGYEKNYDLLKHTTKICVNAKGEISVEGAQELDCRLA